MKNNAKESRRSSESCGNEIEIIDRGGAKFVMKKNGWIAWVKRIFWIFSILWLALAASFPLYVKNHYSGPIKKTIVVSVFFDLQRNINEQYEKLLAGIKKSINIEKPVAIAIKNVKIAQKPVAQARKITTKANRLSNIATKLGAETGIVDSVVAKVDDTANAMNKQLDKIEKDLVKISQTEIDKMIDEAIKGQLDKTSGGLGTTLLTNYGIKHVYPWRPSSWPVGVKIYNDLEKSSVGVVQVITRTVDSYFGYVAWGLIVAAWAIAFIVWMMAFRKMKALISPFLVCPRCGHTYADKRTAYSLLKVLKPWTWL